MPSSEAAPLVGGDVLLKTAAREVRLGFVRKVYGILCVQLLLTVAISAPICMLGPEWVAQNPGLFYGSMICLLVTMCVMTCCHDSLKHFPTNYIFLLILTSAMSVVVGFASAMYTWQSVVLAAGITCGIFACMTAYAWTTSTDFTGCGPYLFAALCAMCMFGFALSIMGLFGAQIEWMYMFFNLVGVLLFTFYIVYDTQLIMGELGGHAISFSIDDYVFASVTLYLDIVNLFLHLLALLGSTND